MSSICVSEAPASMSTNCSLMCCGNTNRYQCISKQLILLLQQCSVYAWNAAVFIVCILRIDVAQYDMSSPAVTTPSALQWRHLQPCSADTFSLAVPNHQPYSADATSPAVPTPPAMQCRRLQPCSADTSSPAVPTSIAQQGRRMPRRTTCQRLRWPPAAFVVLCFLTDSKLEVLGSNPPEVWSM